jgi:hypothetical protein
MMLTATHTGIAPIARARRGGVAALATGSFCVFAPTAG